MPRPSFALRILLIMLVAVVCASPAETQTWTPPIGVPAPRSASKRPLPTARTPIGGQRRDVFGQRNGTPAAPRCTIPTSLAAGSIVQVRGGPYSYSGQSVTWTALVLRLIQCSFGDHRLRRAARVGLW